MPKYPMLLNDLFENASLPLLKGQLPNVRGSYAAFIISMSPENFLSLTTSDEDELNSLKSHPFPFDKEKYVDRLGRESGFGRYEMPFLKVRFPSGQIFGHEGRHRSIMVQRAGGTRVPVVIYPYADTKYEAEVKYYVDDDYNMDIKKLGPFDTRHAADDALAELQAQVEAEDHYVIKAKIETLHGYTLKGQPDRSDGWDRAAWRIDDFPNHLVGQYDESVVVNDFKVGLVKGYRHHTR